MATLKKQIILMAFMMIALSVTVFCVEVTTTWQGNLAVLEWEEPLAYADAAEGQVPFALVCKPYLAWLTDSSAVISWDVLPILENHIRQKGTSSITLFDPDHILDTSSFQIRSAELTGLLPNTVYRYVLKGNSGNTVYRGDTISFETFPPKTTTNFKFTTMGDTRSQVSVPNSLINLIQQFNPKLYLNNGDNNIQGTSAYRYMHQFNKLSSSKLYVPSFGNNDIGRCTHNSPDGKPWAAEHYFGKIPPGSNAAGPARPPYYHSYDIGNIHFVTITTEVMVPGKTNVNGWLMDSHSVLFNTFTFAEQMAWLDEDLRSSNARWKILFTHNPIFDSWAFFAAEIIGKHDVQLIIAASSHQYRRTHRMSPTCVRGVPCGADNNFDSTGTVQLISGAAGITNKWGDPITGIVDPEFYEVANICKTHVVTVEVSYDSILFNAIDPMGVVFDTWVLPRYGQPRTLEPGTGGISISKKPELAANNEVTVSPNPFNPLTKIQYNTEKFQKIEVSIVSPQGRIVKSISKFMPPGKHVEMLDFSTYASGIYAVRLFINDKSHSKKVLYLK